MQSNNSNQNNTEEKPELMSFAQRRAMFSQNIADQQNLYNRQPPKRRQSTPCMVPPPEPISRPRVPSPSASIVPPPQTITPPPAPVSETPPPAENTTPKVIETAKPAETPKVEAKETIPSLSSSFKPSSASPVSRTSSSGQGRVIWVKPDVKPANPLDSRNLTPDQILSNDEAFKIARERRKSDSAVLYAQKMALKQSSGDMPKVFIPPPTSPSPQPGAPVSTSPQPAIIPPPQKAAPVSTSPQPANIPPPQPAAPSPPPVTVRSVPAPEPAAPAKQPENDQKPPPSNVSSTELPKFGSPINKEPNAQEEKVEKKPNKDEPIKPQAFKNAFAFFHSLGVTPRRLSDDIGPEQKEITDLQSKIDSTHRKRAVTDIH